MSDKSFGDTHKCIVKNPLLSTSVTGLSIEDLTHNAVLLPAAPHQLLKTAQDQQLESQQRTLAHTSTNYPSGDANSNTIQSNLHSNITFNPIGSNNNVPHDKTAELLCSTQSKASVKTEDDFDVNEYFARLQGTRYVSAPLNSLLKEDQNANLEETEGNLEEINLNDEKIQNIDDVHQSITADIAQNFSQLPTVLPQMASVVFSSFSNMLSLKSREQTPDEGKPNFGEQVMPPVQKPEGIGVPLGVADYGVREVAPPPKEPPIGGGGNYRIGSKKKAYAQIPGLTGDNQHIQAYTPPTMPAPTTTMTAPSFFIPTVTEERVAPAYKAGQNDQALNKQIPGFTGDTQHIQGFTPPTMPAPTTTMTAPSLFIPTVTEERVAPEYKAGQNDQALNKQNPGLTGDTQHIQAYTPPTMPAPTTSMIAPSFFVPTVIEERVAPEYKAGENDQALNKQIPGLTGDIQHIQDYTPPTIPAPTSSMTAPSFFVPAVTEKRVAPEYKAGQNDQASNKETQNYIFDPLDKSNVINKGADLVVDAFVSKENSTQHPTAPVQDNISYTQPSNTAIIPPPPMFCNLPKKDSQTTVGKTILPPSVARRITANQPIIKAQNTVSVPTFPDIFVPAPLPESDHNPVSIQENTQILPSALPANVQSFAPIDVPTNAQKMFEIKSIQPSTMLLPPTTSSPPVIQPTPTTSLPTIPQPTSIPEIPMFMPPTLTQPVGGLPPTFFNPTPLQNETPKEPENTQSNVSQLFAPESSSTSILEPPKASTTQSFRMTKKRPQYYSGPIEGIGSISNNVKPIIAPVETNVFHGAMMIPAQHAPAQGAETSNIEQSTIPFDISRPGESSSYTAFGTGAPSLEQSVPFDISKPKENATSYTQFELNKQQNHTYTEPVLNTTFDLSRQTTDIYEPPKQESKGFGIIGSLKSKLTSIDINKIQNSVTTFFDPAYNTTKVEATSTKENVPYQKYQTPYEQNQRNQESNFEIYVSNVEPRPYGQDYSYQSYQNPNPLNYDQNSQSNQYYQEQNQYSYYQNVYPSYSDAGLNQQQMYKEVTASTTDLPTSTSYVQENQPHYEQNCTLNAAATEKAQELATATLPSHSSDKLIESDQNVNVIEAITEQEPQAAAMQEPISLAKSFFDDHQPVKAETKPEELEEIDSADVQAKTEDKLYNLSVDRKQNEFQIFGSANVISPLDFFSLHTNDTKTDEYEYTNFDLVSHTLSALGLEDENSQTKTIDDSVLTNDVPIVDVSSVPLFGLSTILADKSKELDIESEIKDLVTENNDVETIFDTEVSSSFFDNIINPESKIDSQLADSGSDLNICETCREVNKPEPEEREVEDLTTQLIENITSPIQLSNPVEVPLTESNTVVENRDDFNTNQCAEISHITEETIKSNQMQSANELLDDVDDINAGNLRSYGWCTEDTPFTASKTLLDQGPFQTDPNAIGFFGNNSLFFDNIPNNASDELKAEFKNSHEDILPRQEILPRQMSIPSAPPAEDFDDTKSDETGVLDVHSIEQDAKKDFPIFEEFVIEPSETDDDKIEYREKERSSEDPVPDIDTFTNRVERFKKMEETGGDVFEGQSAQIFDLTSTNSPAITIASYFDTGNYAAETHYKNSLCSPNFNVGLSSTSLSIPPGFEEEFRRRLSEMSSQTSGIQKVPDTTTQTRTSPTITLCTAKTVESKSIYEDVVGTTETEFKPSVENKQPDFASVFSDNKITEATPAAPEVPKQQKVEQPLPDPINFFSSTVEPSNRESSEETSFSRLASYFTAPKTDHSKSFFDLSQGQDHYRQGAQNEAFESKVQEEEKIAGGEDHKNFFELSQSQGHYMEHNQNVTQNIANLMKDLTSCQNVEPQKDQTVRTVNYFTVEYDNGRLTNDLNIGEPKLDKTEKEDSGLKSERNGELEETEHLSDSKAMTLINKCNDCCNLKIGAVHKVVCIEGRELDKCKVRKATGGEDSVGKTGTRGDMDQSKDYGGRAANTNLEVTLHEDNDDGVTTLTENRPTTEYAPVKYHWFYRVDYEGKSIWRGFSVTDSRSLEDAFNSPDLNENTLVPTDGGRFDVNIVGRTRIAVYWSDKPTNVRRCSWFYKGNTDARYVPYTEAVAEKLEAEYRHGMTTGEWHRRLVLPNNELVVMHGPNVIVHFLQSTTADTFAPQAMFTFGKRVYRNPPKIRVSRDQPQLIDHLILLVHGAGEYRSQKEKSQSTVRPRVVRRGCDESEIEDVEPSSIDHLLLLCHGVGSACDMRFRSVEEVVDDFRATSLQLIQSHYRNSYDNGIVGRVEVLPISWHATLHSGETGVDKRLTQITLDSIPRLRSFTNDTVLDVLFYTSPIFCQTIIDTVCNELNRIYNLFRSRNPHFKGGVSLGGHSLGSVILYDLLSHQTPDSAPPPSPSSPPSPPSPQGDKRYVSGSAGTGQPSVRYASLHFSPDALYALGSPIAIFECIRGVESLGLDFALPTCKRFFNIFHPFDPIAYRIEPLINPQLKNVKPFQIPHHKGRKRMHLELKDTMARVGADIKQKLIESIKTTWSNMWRTQPPPTEQLEKVVEEEMEKDRLCEESKEELPQGESVTPEMMGLLNDGRRVDYVLQEAPFEMINEYLFAMSSHVCYWTLSKKIYVFISRESEDTMLLMLREIYDSLGVQPDSTIPQQSMTVQRTRSPKIDDTIVMNTSDFPSTSRGST